MDFYKQRGRGLTAFMFPVQNYEECLRHRPAIARLPLGLKRYPTAVTFI